MAKEIDSTVQQLWHVSRRIEILFQECQGLLFIFTCFAFNEVILSFFFPWSNQQILWPLPQLICRRRLARKWRISSSLSFVSSDRTGCFNFFRFSCRIRMLTRRKVSPQRIKSKGTQETKVRNWESLISMARKQSLWQSVKLLLQNVSPKMKLKYKLPW